MANYYLRYNDRVSGPFPIDTLKTMARDGLVTSAHALSLDREQWFPADHIPGLLESSSRPMPTGDSGAGGSLVDMAYIMRILQDPKHRRKVITAIVAVVMIILLVIVAALNSPSRRYVPGPNPYAFAEQHPNRYRATCDFCKGSGKGRSGRCIVCEGTGKVWRY